MKYRIEKLSKITKTKINDKVTLEEYICEKSPDIDFNKRPGLLIIPGGGYKYCSRREAEPLALRFMSEGFNCFVLNYTCEAAYPTPHKELAIAFKYIKENAKKFNINPDAISLTGYSAGGHLASTYSYLYEDFEKELKVKKDFLKPFALILGYPVTSMDIRTTSATEQIITNNFDKKLIKKLTVDKHITKDFPPTFIWTTKFDQVVPYKHSIVIADEMKKHNVKHKLILYKDGYHGGSLCNKSVYPQNANLKNIEENRDWPNKAADFIFSLIK